jgi:hypothetical protein
MTTAIFSNLPITKLEDVLTGMRKLGVKVKIRYRGSRNTLADRGRSRNSRQTTCLKENAKTFTVYHL